MRYLVTRIVPMSQITTVDAETEADALFIAYKDFASIQAGRYSQLDWSPLDEFDPPSLMVEPSDNTEDTDDDNDDFLLDDTD